jgi:hypothetical protein
MAENLTMEQIDAFRKDGYIILPNLLTQGEVRDLQRWAQDVHDWKPTAQSKFMPYEVCLLLPTYPR